MADIGYARVSTADQDPALQLGALSKADRRQTTSPLCCACGAGLIETCKLIAVEPQAYLADVIGGIANGHPRGGSTNSCPGPISPRPTAAPERAAFCRRRVMTMTKPTMTWRQDGIDPGWFFAEGIGSVRSSKSYNRPGGWWFLPAWLPDTEEHDIGPFRS